MNLNSGMIAVVVCAACLLVSTIRTHAFALLGPVQPWMQVSNGVIFSYDIGGPMEITNEYRWNVPVVTYGFDKSFLDFFGTNGVAAVESAIKVLNDLPPASQIVLTNYPFTSRQINFSTQAQSLLDLKSQTLSLLLGQLGLAQPTRYIYTIKTWNPILLNYPELLSPWLYGATNDVVFNFVARLNFDPLTLTPSPYVSGTLFSAQVLHSQMNLAVPFTVDPLASSYTPVADSSQSSGQFYTGLTRDDVGGLRYLLSTNNVNYETLLADVHGIGSNSFMNGAWRPGVEKITFVPHPVSLLSGIFQPYTNQYTDTYITNSNAAHQQLQRVVLRPDFLFSAGNDSFRTGTTNWINNAALNNNPTGAGPGVIQPSVVITLQKAGRWFDSFSSTPGWSEDAVQDTSLYYGSFNGSTNAPIVYPVPQTGNISLVVRVVLRHANGDQNSFHSFEWLPTSQAGTIYALQTSTNLSTWKTLFVVTNNGSVCTYQNVNANSSSRFYRLIPQ